MLWKDLIIAQAFCLQMPEHHIVYVANKVHLAIPVVSDGHLDIETIVTNTTSSTNVQVCSKGEQKEAKCQTSSHKQ